MKEQRVALITGASSGIGLAVCRLFKIKGWRVIGVARHAPDNIEPMGRYLKADISQPEAIDKIAASIQQKEGRLDALINNAAQQICKSILETTPKEWNKVFQTNVQSAFLLARQLHKLLKRSKGAIVNVASVHAAATSANISAYAASKGALVALTRSMAIEFAKDGIRANAVLPGAVDTPMLREGLKRGHIKGGSEEELIEGLGRKHILGRVGRPEEIGQAVLFLADNERSSFMTGQTMIVDGGALAKLSTE